MFNSVSIFLNDTRYKVLRWIAKDVQCFFPRQISDLIQRHHPFKEDKVDCVSEMCDDFCLREGPPEYLLPSRPGNFF